MLTFILPTKRNNLQEIVIYVHLGTAKIGIFYFFYFRQLHA